MTRGAAENGFSLIELLVVVAITSVLAVGASLALPRGQDSLAVATSEIERAVRDMRVRAMLSGTPMYLDARSITGTTGVALGKANWRFAPDGSVSGAPFEMSRATDRMVCRIVKGSVAKCSPG